MRDEQLMDTSESWDDWTFSRPATLSILDLIESRTLDFKLAGLLWLIMETRASLLVASAPVYAGKTTLLHALLDLLPPEQPLYSLKGFAETFVFPNLHKPESVYLVSEEISNHQYEYLWGQQVQKTFRLMRQGYRLGSTIHASTIQDVAYIFYGYLNVPLADIANLGVIVTLHAMNGRTYYDDPIRRVHAVTVIDMDDKKLVARTLAARESLDGAFTYPQENALREVLQAKFGIKHEHIFSEIDARGTFLEQLFTSGIRSREDVKKAVSEFYRSRSG